jgi:hypothetical protein
VYCPKVLVIASSYSQLWLDVGWLCGAILFIDPSLFPWPTVGATSRLIQNCQDQNEMLWSEFPVRLLK